MGAVSCSPVRLCLRTGIPREKPSLQPYLKLGKRRGYGWGNRAYSLREHVTQFCCLRPGDTLSFLSGLHSPADRGLNIGPIWDQP